MLKYKCINGYTKETMIAKIKEKNNGRPAKTITGKCVYREGSNACAIGCFIPDELYNPQMDISCDYFIYDYKITGEVGVNALLKAYPDLKNYIPLSLEGLLKMQGVHDCSIDDTHENLIDFINNHVED